MIINPGASEKSAYQYAVDGGYKGTEDEFRTLMGSAPRSGSVSFGGSSGPVYRPPTVVNGMVWDTLLVNGPITLSAKKIQGVADPTDSMDSTNKYYVDREISAAKLAVTNSVNESLSSISSKSVKTHKFTVQGPISIGGTFDLTFSGLESSPFSGDTIFFGPEIDFAFTGNQHKNYQFEQITWQGDDNYDGTKYTYGGTISMKALTEIPEGTSVDILLVWI